MTRRSPAGAWAPPAALGALVLAAGPLLAFVIDKQWNDFAPILMDNVFLGGNWAALAEGELAKWNGIRSINNDHPFLINPTPEFLFDTGDGDNTMGFLDGAALMAEYNLSYGPAIAWTAVLFDASTRVISEADIMFDPARSWSVNTNSPSPFTTVMLHESGHAQGLSHEPFRLSIMYPNANSPLAATLFSDDWAGIDSRYTLLQEVDVQALSVWHDTTQPRWMTISTNSLAEGQPITFTNFTWENRGNLTAPSPGFQIVLSDTPALTPPLTVIDSWTEAEIRGHDYTTLARTVTMPAMSDCAVKYAGLFIPSNASWNERFEQNNLVVFKNGSSTPQPLTISLARDALEPNDSFTSPRALPPSPYNADLTIDQDGESDFFLFYLAATRWVFLSITYTQAAGDIDMVLYDGNQNPIVSATTGIGFNEIRQRLDPGFYYLQIYGNGAGSCNHYYFSYLNFECLYQWECDPTSTTFCQSKTCENFVCVPVVPRPCDDGDPCTRDICNQDHGGYCLFAPDPSLDPDGDGVCASLDCSPQDPQTWALPAEASALALDADEQTLTWDSLASQAGPGVVYDLLRGTMAAGGSAPTSGDLCVAGIGASVAQDAAYPDPGQAFWYLVRGRNSCGTGAFGLTGGGTEGSVAPCE